VRAYGTTWHDPECAKQKQRLLYSNLLPKLQLQPVYRQTFHHEDWGDKQYNALKKRVQRAGVEHNFLVVDNVGSRGVYVVFTTLKIKRWTECEDVESAWHEAVANIWVPVPDPTTKFQPVRGSRGWVKGATSVKIDHLKEWERLGVLDNSGVDDVIIEAEARAQGIDTEYTQVYKRWRKASNSRYQLMLYPESSEQSLRFWDAYGVKLAGNLLRNWR
jgi:hypothetical protein